MASTLDSFNRSPFSSKKIDNYFDVYDHLFKDWVGKDVRFVEIGILEGGSLFMWRDYFGDRARIIGIDLNPQAKKWESHGFEIYIGDQADPNFWRQLHHEMGEVDIVLDDGGHTNTQQIITVIEGSKMISQGGMIVIEDCHSNYMSVFNNPSKNSFINYSKKGIDHLTSRFEGLRNSGQKVFGRIWSIEFFQSVVVFRIRNMHLSIGQNIKNSGESIPVDDFRYSNDGHLLGKIRLLQDYFALGYASVGNTRPQFGKLNWFLQEKNKDLTLFLLSPVNYILKFSVKLLTFRESRKLKKYLKLESDD